MKHKYLFRRETGPLNTNSTIYVVWVGESEREQKLLAQVKHEAFHSGYTIKLWDYSVALWLDLESERVFSGAGLLNFGFSRVEVTISELRELCFSSCWESFESQLVISQAKLRMLRESRPDLYAANSSNRNTRSCALLKRKNLSQEVRTL